MKRLIPLLFLGCAGAQSVPRSVVDCKLGVLEPRIAGMTQVAIGQLISGEPDPVAVLLGAGIDSVTEARALADALLACHGE